MDNRMVAPEYNYPQKPHNKVKMANYKPQTGL